MDIMLLEDGTEFFVISGCWDGRVEIKEDGFYIRVLTPDWLIKVTDENRYDLVFILK